MSVTLELFFLWLSYNIYRPYNMLLCVRELFSKDDRLDGVEALAFSAKYLSALFLTYSAEWLEGVSWCCPLATKRFPVLNIKRRWQKTLLTRVKKDKIHNDVTPEDLNSKFNLSPFFPK